MNWDLPYPSRRQPVLARNVVATSQPLAVQAGIAALERGGNAVDAALAAAITLVVVEPTNNGLGSDAFAIISTPGPSPRLHGINASGRSPAKLDADRLASADKMPLLGWDAVTVPGAVACWVDLSRRFGRLPFADLFERAIRYARDGFAVSPVTAQLWATVAPLYASMPSFAAAFLPGGRSPQAGETFRLPELATSLERIAQSEGEDFYRGDLAASIAKHATSEGAALVMSDLESHALEEVDTISTPFRDHTLHELPPNGQGLAALIALGVLDHASDGALDPDSAEGIHLQIEAMKIGFAEVHAHLGDPENMRVTCAELLADDYLRRQASGIDRDRASNHSSAIAPRGGDTVYLTAADADGMMVSFIQSNYFSFGSGIVVPGTGISLQNRGAGFTTGADHPNRVAAGKRPFHTIIPAFVTTGSEPLMSFGVMGGAMQPQGHLQVMVRMAAGSGPQAALDAPRWQVSEDDPLGVAVEAAVPDAVVAGLERRGHRMRRLGPEWFGGGQAALRHGDGYVAASDPRKDGHAAGF